jgi:hypothetical protein
LNIGPMTSTAHVYEVHPRKDKRGVDLISDALPFGRLWYGEQNVRGAAIPENENDRPKRSFQGHGLDLCQTVRGLASAIYLDKPAQILPDILLSKLVTFQLRFSVSVTFSSHGSQPLT